MGALFFFSLSLFGILPIQHYFRSISINSKHNILNRIISGRVVKGSPRHDRDKTQ
ncbi:hypothetical protein AMTRI_Chr03g143340 [Amborella trichopoda]